MNIYCFSTLSFAKLQFKSVINKAFHKHGVASFTDAWIETMNVGYDASLGKSHLLQMRGLKQPSSGAPASSLLSHLLQMRGLKLSASTRNSGGTSSHLLQMRGLKPEKLSLNLRACLVASFTDAWIETVRTWERRMKNEVASFTDAWIETVNAF